jgi:hypothetical protein
VFSPFKAFSTTCKHENLMNQKEDKASGMAASTVIVRKKTLLHAYNVGSFDREAIITLFYSFMV